MLHGSMNPVRQHGTRHSAGLYGARCVLGRKGGGRERGKSEGIAGEENESFLFMGPVVVVVPKIPPTLFPLFTQAWKALITVKVEYAVLSF